MMITFKQLNIIAISVLHLSIQVDVVHQNNY